MRGHVDRVALTRHVPALDGLRALAVIAVLAFHLGWISGGYLGVDLFFVLSGFLITSLLLEDGRSARGVRLRTFWGRRFRRLLPAVALMITAVLGWLAVWGTAAEQATAREDARWAIPYLANWHLIAQARDYWASATDPSVFTHLWSLAVEEQFYVVWPVIVWLLVRRGGDRGLGRSALPWVTGGLALASWIAMVMLHNPSAPSRVYLGTDTRAFALLLGALAAMLPLARRPVDRRSDLVAVGAAAGIVALWFVGGGNVLAWLLRGGLLLHSGLAVVLIALVAAERTHLSRPLSTRPLVWVGQRSYGIYLWHWPVLVLLRPRTPDLPAALRDAIVIVMSFLLAEASYRWVEHPIRRANGWATGPTAARATGALLAVAALVALVAPSGLGHVASFDPASVALAAPSTIASAPTPTTTAPPAPTGGSMTPTTTIPPATTTTLPRRHVSSVLWIGDSVAADLAPAVEAALGAAGLTVVDGSIDGARFTEEGTVRPKELYTAMLAEHPSDLVVVQMTLWDSEAPTELMREGVRWFHDLVLASGADLVFVTPPPVRTDLMHAGLADQLAIVHELEVADPTRVHVVDSAPLWGLTMQRDMDGDGIPDRKPDGVHVCPQGAARYAAWLVDRLDGVVDGLTPVFPSAWLTGEWTSSRRFDTPVGACVALAG